MLKFTRFGSLKSYCWWRNSRHFPWAYGSTHRHQYHKNNTQNDQRGVVPFFREVKQIKLSDCQGAVFAVRALRRLKTLQRTILHQGPVQFKRRRRKKKRWIIMNLIVYHSIYSDHRIWEDLQEIMVFPVFPTNSGRSRPRENLAATRPMEPRPRTLLLKRKVQVALPSSQVSSGRYMRYIQLSWHYIYIYT